MKLISRDACIHCGATSLKAQWRSSFSEPQVQRWLSEYHYSGDPASSLSGERIERVRCAACGMSFHRHVLDDAGMHTLYSEWISRDQIAKYEAGSAQRPSEFDQGIEHARHALRLRALLDGRTGARRPRHLDFGCGDGLFPEMLSHFGFDAWGLDMSASRAESAGAGRGFRFARSFDELHAHDLRFDSASLFEVLEHLADPDLVLRGIWGVLEPHGVLIVEVPDCSDVDGAPDDALRFSKVNVLEHINHFTPDSLSRFVCARGFEPLRPPIALIAASAQRLARNLARQSLERVGLRRSTRQYFRRTASAGDEGRAATRAQGLQSQGPHQQQGMS